jgi:hypothetical protein
MRRFILVGLIAIVMTGTGQACWYPGKFVGKVFSCGSRLIDQRPVTCNVGCSVGIVASCPTGACQIIPVGFSQPVAGSGCANGNCPAVRK